MECYSSVSGPNPIKIRIRPTPKIHSHSRLNKSSLIKAGVSYGRPLSSAPLVGATEVTKQTIGSITLTRTHARNAHARTCICKRHLLYTTCCSSSSRRCGKVENDNNSALSRENQEQLAVENYVEKLLTMLKGFT